MSYFSRLFAGQRPQWFEDLEEHLRYIKAQGWEIREPIEFHWTGHEEAVYTIEPEDINE